MERAPGRTLEEDERRKMAARMLAVAAGRPPTDGRPLARPRRREGRKAPLGREPARRLRRGARWLEGLLLDLREWLGFRAALCAAAAAWSLALVLVLGSLGAVGR